MIMKSEVLQSIEEREHEQVTVFHYPKVGLKAIVAIHNTALGPALGGCRMRLYEDESQAFDDVLRLSEGMTYKSAIAGMSLGGGKSCIIGDPDMAEGREALFSQFAQCLNHLSGRYITAEDMGTSVEDMVVMREISPHVAGHDSNLGGSGDPSPWTALGVFESIREACFRRFPGEDLSKRSVAIQGVGHVGYVLAQLLAKEGVRLVVTDPRSKTLDKIQSELNVEVVGLDKIYEQECDVFAPCAIGQTVNPASIKRLKCSIIAGAANNILSDREAYDLLQSKGILYCPDFVVNSGGVISVGAELNEGGWNEAWVRDMISKIPLTLREILDRSESESRFSEDVAIEVAKERVNAGKQV
jgi:leucine dehydrogenase